VLPCTQDFFGYYVLGNVKDTQIRDIWNNEKMQRLREKALQRDIEDLKTCSQCDRVWREKIIGIPKEYLWKFIFKRMP
jgi:radical SAM protein with 4Fe4S-binding SPASM domain